MEKKIRKNISTYELLCSICKKRMEKRELFMPYKGEFAHPSCIKKIKIEVKNNE